MSAHAKLSPSASKRWMNCPGSVSLIDYLIEQGLIEADTTSDYAEEGSAAHLLGEWGLTKDPDINNYIGVKIYGDWKVTEEMCEAVQVYLDFIWGCINHYNSDDYNVEMGVEIKCSLKVYLIPGLDGGTSDVVLVITDLFTGEITIHVIDYKHGKGVAVDVIDNSQAKQYGLGTLLKLPKKQQKNVTNVILTIVQPRAFHPDGVIRSWEISAKDLLAWGSDILVPAAKATHEDDAPLVPGDEQCRFCPAKGQCKALYAKTQEIAMLDFKDEALPDPRVMTDEQMMVVLDAADLINEFIKAVIKESRNRLDAGSEDYEHRYKLVKSKTHRKLNENAVEDLSLYIDEDALFEKKLKCLGAIEKALKPDYSKKEIIEIMQEVTTKPDGALVIAPVTDKRQAIESSAVTDFEGLEDQEDFDDWD